MTEIIDELRKVGLLVGMDDGLLLKIAEVVETEFLEPGMALVEQNEIGADLFFVRAGVLSVTVKNGGGSMEVAQLGAGDVVGETQMISGGRRTATVRAKTACEILRLPHAAFDELVINNESLRNAISDLIHHRLRESALRLALPQAIGDDPELLDLLSARADWVRIERGELLWRQGQSADGWYVLVSGELSVFVTEHGVDRQIGLVKRGEVFGELALLHDEPRTAAILANRESWLARFDTQLMEQEVLTRDTALRALVKTFARRLSLGTEAGNITTPVITVLPRDGSIDTEAFVVGLTAAMGPGGRVVNPETLYSEGVVGGAEELPVEHPAWLRFEAWLESQREEAEYVLLVTSGDDNPWTRTAVDRADTVLLMVDAEKNPALTKMERDVLGRFEEGQSPALWLVLEYPEDHFQPEGTARWLDARSLDHHAHVRQGHKRDIGRLARWLTGQIHGVALSGGGARGFTHLGVVSAMYEHGYEIDLISGTSAGSMAGGLLARARSPVELMEGALIEIEAAGNPFVEFDIPLISILRNKSMSNGLRNTFGEVAIEDNWIPLRIVATNLTESRRVAFDRGPVWQRVLAASSPPGIMAPVIDNGQLLCDGGLVDNLPVSVLLEHSCKLHFASYVGSAPTLPAQEHGLPTSWAFLLDKVLGRKRHANVPTLLTTLLQCVSVPAAAQLEDARKVADVFFEPDLSDFSVTDIGAAREMFDAGYAHAKTVLARMEASNDAG